jgi:hypothetical protein
MNDLNLNPIPNNFNCHCVDTDINKNDLTKKGCLEFDLPVIEDKIVVGNKKFDDIRSAVKYLVKQSNEYSYNIQIKNIAPTPTKIHVVTTFDYQEPRRETITRIIDQKQDFFRKNVYMVDNSAFYQLEDAVKYIVGREYGKYMDLVIERVRYWNQEVEVELKFIDIPDIDEDMEES